MRDPNLALELRVDLATAAAPFVHGKPRHPGHGRSKSGGPSSDVNGEGANSGTEMEGTNSGVEKGVNSGTETGVGSGTAKEGVDSSPEKRVVALAGVGEAAAEASEGLRAPETIVPVIEAPPIVPASKSAADVSPLDFLLSVMNDPQAPPYLRIKVARVTASYVHAKTVQAKPDELAILAIEDPYGFTFDLDVMKALQEDFLALQKIPSDRGDEKRAIQKRIFERQMTLPHPPAAYKEEDYVRDNDDLWELNRILKTKGPGFKGAKKIEAEAVILSTRVMAYKANLDGPLLSRLSELMDKRNRDKLTFDEHGELAGLFSRFPHLERPPFVDAFLESCRLAAQSYRRDYDPAKPDARPKPESTGGDPYWAAQRIYRQQTEEREAKKKLKR